MGVKALAAGMGIDSSTVTRQVAPLVDTGLVKRTSHPEDGRAVVLQLSAARPGPAGGGALLPARADGRADRGLGGGGARGVLHAAHPLQHRAVRPDGGQAPARRRRGLLSGIGIRSRLLTGPVAGLDMRPRSCSCAAVTSRVDLGPVPAGYCRREGAVRERQAAQDAPPGPGVRGVRRGRGRAAAACRHPAHRRAAGANPRARAPADRGPRAHVRRAGTGCAARTRTTAPARSSPPASRGHVRAWRHRRPRGGALDRLTPQERLVLVLRLYEGVAEEQAAAQLGLPAGAGPRDLPARGRDAQPPPRAAAGRGTAPRAGAGIRPGQDSAPGTAAP